MSFDKFTIVLRGMLPSSHCFIHSLSVDHITNVINIDDFLHHSLLLFSSPPNLRNEGQTTFKGFTVIIKFCNSFLQ